MRQNLKAALARFLTVCVLGSAAALAETEPELELEEFEVPSVLWEKSLNLRGALGFKDNVLLSNVQRDASGFWQSALDFSLLRYALESGATFTLFGSAEDRRYWDSEEIEKEQFVISQARLEMPAGESWKFGSSLQYFYLDQVFDVSASEEIFDALAVQGHRIGVAPFVTRALPSQFSVQLELLLDRHFYNAPLDDYWEGGPRLSISRKYGHRSEAALEYGFFQRYYDTRTQYGLNSLPLAGTSLRYDQHEIEFVLNHSWNKARTWRSRLKAGYKISDDNGPGFFDYQRFRLSKRIGYYAPDWQVAIEGKILHYDYDRQRLFGSNDLRALWEYVLGVRFERKLWKNLKVFAESEHELVRSTFAFEEYRVNTVLAGVDWEF